MCPKTQINHAGRWASFPEDYRKEAFETIAKMIANQQSGVVVGGSGTGKSNVAGLLAARPELLFRLNLLPDQDYLFCLVDINKLSESDSTYFYRGMLRELYKCARSEELPIADDLYQLEIETRRWNDEQSWAFALDDAHDWVINRAGKRLVWLFDRFDKACPKLNDSTLDTLRSLRDNNLFNGKLFYFVFSRKPLQRLRDWKVNSEFLEIVESNTCWIGPMVNRDARWNVQQIARRQQTEIEASDETAIIELTGGLPAFTKTASEAWLKEEALKSKPIPELQQRLLEQQSIRRTCTEILEDLEPMERETLILVASELPSADRQVDYLINNGLLKKEEKIGKNGEKEGQWVIFSPLLQAFLLEFQAKKPGFISINAHNTGFLMDGTPLEIHLANMEFKLLAYMVDHPNRLLTYEELVDLLWPGDPAGKYDRIGSLATQAGKLSRMLTKLKPSLGKRVIAESKRGYRFIQPEISDDQQWIVAR